MRRMLFPLISIATIAISSASSPVQAQVMYDNGSFVGARVAQDITHFAIADDFIIDSPLTFNAIRFFAVDLVPGLLVNFSGTLSWAIHASLGTTPNAIPSTTIVASGSTSLVTMSDTGQLWAGVAGYQVAQLDFSIPSVTLPAGTYWLRIKEGLPASAGDSSIIAWLHTGGPITGNGYRMDHNIVAPSNWNIIGTTNMDLSYQLLNNPAPEPGTLTLLGAGLSIVGLAARRRK